MFSSISILLVGDSRLTDILRALCCLELYINADFYADHPNFKYTFFFHKDIYASPKTLLSIAVTDKSLKSDKQGSDLVKEESIALCKDKEWASFLFFLALSSVTNRRLLCLYPSFGTARLISFFSNQLVLPRSFYNSSSSFPDNVCHLLFGSLSSKGNLFKANHFVPLIIKTNKKRSSINYSNTFPPLPKKEKISSFTSFKNNKTMYNYFIRKTSKVLVTFLQVLLHPLLPLCQTPTLSQKLHSHQ